MLCGTCVRLHAGVPDRQQLANAGLVLVLGASDWQRAMLRAELVRLCPQLDPGAKPSRRGGGRRARQPVGDAGTAPPLLAMPRCRAEVSAHAMSIRTVTWAECESLGMPDRHRALPDIALPRV